MWGIMNAIDQLTKKQKDRLRRLTPRQKDCLRLVAHGLKSKEIGPRLGISHVTVDNYLRTAIELLGVADRYKAAHMLVMHELDQPLIHQPLDLASELLPSASLPCVRDWGALRSSFARISKYRVVKPTNREGCRDAAQCLSET
jgi:DNA-binding CsgD family transcriptional regulator